MEIIDRYNSNVLVFKASSEVRAIRNQAKEEGRVSPVVEPGNATWKALSYTDLSEDDRKIAMNLTGTYVRRRGESNSSVVEWYGPQAHPQGCHVRKNWGRGPCAG